MYYVIDNELLSKLKQLAASDSNNTDVIEALAASEANPLLNGLFWTRNNMMVECRNLVKRCGSQNEFFEVEDVDDVEQPLSDPVREALAKELAGDADMYFPGVSDEVEVELAHEAVVRICFAVECEAMDQKIRKSTIKRIVSNEDAIINSLQAVSDEVIAGGLHSCAKHILAELLVALSEHPELFPKSRPNRDEYRYDDEFYGDW